VVEGQFNHYFGDAAIGDPEEDLILEEYDDDVAGEKLKSTKKPYTKVMKQERFKDVLGSCYEKVFHVGCKSTHFDC
jgi:hypothetical protein